MKRKILFAVLMVTCVFIIAGCDKKEKNNISERIIFKLDTDGLGQVSYYIDEENKIDFDDEYPNQSTYTTFEGTATITIDAKADEGWKFIKWTKDGKDYSKDSKLDITISEDAKLIAVFEPK